MSHQEKQRIFDELSTKQWSSTFEEFLDYTICEVRNKELDHELAINQIIELVYEACDLVQEEQQKRIAEKAKMLLHDGFHKSNKQTKYYHIGADNLQIDKSSITNPENKIQ